MLDIWRRATSSRHCLLCLRFVIGPSSMRDTTLYWTDDIAKIYYNVFSNSYPSKPTLVYLYKIYSNIYITHFHFSFKIHEPAFLNFVFCFHIFKYTTLFVLSVTMDRYVFPNYKSFSLKLLHFNFCLIRFTKGIQYLLINCLHRNMSSTIV